MNPIESPFDVRGFRPSDAYLAERLCYALDFAKRALTHLIVEGHSAPEDAPWYVRPEKLIAETGLLMVYARAAQGYSGVANALNALADVLEPLARSKAVLGNICLKPALALDYACAHICLSYLGRPNALFDEALAGALESGNQTERTPYRMLEQAWLMRLWNGTNKPEENALWTKLGCMNHRPDLFSESSDDVYATTHAAMYLFFHGETPAAVEVESLIDRIESWLVIYMDKQDYDIAGELLLAWSLTGKPFSAKALFALHCLVKIEARVGFLPAPNLNPGMIEEREPDERRTYIYSVNYHTAFVMGLLCAGLLAQVSPHDTVASEVIHNVEWGAMLKRELNAGKHAHWMDYYKSLDASQQEVLMPWLYETLLVRMLRDYRYDAVEKLLSNAKGTAFENALIYRQAASLLERIALMAKI